MSAHKYWRAIGLFPLSQSGLPLELGEFQLFNGATRIDAAATLTANQTPTSGTLAQLKDGVTTAGPIFPDGWLLQLSWAFPAAVEVDGVLLGARTTIARFPTAGLLQGGDSATSPWRTVRGFGGARFVSANLTPILPLSDPMLMPRPIVTAKDYRFEGGRGLITDTVKTQIKTNGTPTDFPTFCKVRLLRDIDGKVIRETWTDPVTGIYRFDYFDETFTYTVIAFHPLHSFRAVIADQITPSLMP